MENERNLSKQWSEAPAVDRKAIIGSLKAHVRQATERREAYVKEHEDNADDVILQAFDARQNTAEIAMQILGEDI